jgi:hypothetical protein
MRLTLSRRFVALVVTAAMVVVGAGLTAGLF